MYRTLTWSLVSGLAILSLAGGCSPDPGSDTGDGGIDTGETEVDTNEADSAAADTDTRRDADADAADTRTTADTNDAAGDDADASSMEPECRDWESEHPEWLWCDGFEGSEGLDSRYSDVSKNGMAIRSDDAFRGSKSLRQHYQTGQVSAGWASLHIADAPASDGSIPAQEELYVRFYHKFEAGFQGLPPKMARIRHLAPDWTKKTAVHMWIGDDSKSIVADVYAPSSSQSNNSGWLAVERSNFDYSKSSNIGRWVCLEMYVKNNTPGNADGAYRFWADGQKIIERTGVDLTGSTDQEFNEIMLDTYWNGGSPKAQNRYYDNLVISKQRIGCL